MAMKVQLVARIADLIRERGLSQEGAAKVLSLTQPKISKLLKGQIRRIFRAKFASLPDNTGEGR
jgi:predicted XRE-type DNA-binding protein